MQKKKAFKMHMVVKDITPIPKVEIIAEIDQLYNQVLAAGQYMGSPPSLTYPETGTITSRFAP